MPLSNSLLSEFVKNTKDKNKNTKKETFVRGTLVLDEEKNKWFVKIDGSEILTPISTTSNVDTTKPVTVMIKNHTATVIGNTSTDIVGSENNILNSTQESISYIDASVITAMWNEYEQNKN